MSRFIQTCFVVDDDQVAKHGSKCAVGRFVLSTVCLVAAIPLVARVGVFGGGLVPLQTGDAPTSETLVDRAASPDSRAVTLPGDVVMHLNRVNSSLRTVAFYGSVVLLALAFFSTQCGLLFQKL